MRQQLLIINKQIVKGKTCKPMPAGKAVFDSAFSLKFSFNEPLSYFCSRFDNNSKCTALICHLQRISKCKLVSTEIARSRFLQLGRSGE